MNFDIIKSVFLILFFCFQVTYSQTGIIYADEINESVDSLKQDVPFVIIDQVPVYKGCVDLLTNSEKKKCMEQKISKHVLRNFNTSILKAKCIEYKKKGKKKICMKSEYWPGFSKGIIRIFVQFKISKEGRIVDVKARAPHEDLKKEALRVVSSIPKLIPGVHKGEKVGVLYSLPITYRIE